MAEVSLQAESAPANPTLLSLHSASVTLEALADDMADLSALAELAARADDLDPLASKALRSIAARLDSLVRNAERDSEAFLDASRAQRAALQ